MMVRSLSGQQNANENAASDLELTMESQENPLSSVESPNVESDSHQNDNEFVPTETAPVASATSETEIDSDLSVAFLPVSARVAEESGDQKPVVQAAAGDAIELAMSQSEFWPDKTNHYINLEKLVIQTLHADSRFRFVSARIAIQPVDRLPQDSNSHWTSFLDTSWNRQDQTPVQPMIVEQQLVSESRPSLLERLRYRMRGETNGRGEANGIVVQENAVISDRASATTRRGFASRFWLDYDLPQAGGAGSVPERRQILMVRLDLPDSAHQSRELIGQTITKAVSAYWNLYQARVNLAIQIDNARRVNDLISKLESLDSESARQNLPRVREIATTRKSALIQAHFQAISAQEKLFECLGQGFKQNESEIIPVDLPPELASSLDANLAVQSGIECRPEIQSAIAEVKSEADLYQVNYNSLAPQLGGIVSRYVSGAAT